MHLGRDGGESKWVEGRGRGSGGFGGGSEKIRDGSFEFCNTAREELLSHLQPWRRMTQQGAMCVCVCVREGESVKERKSGG